MFDFCWSPPCRCWRQDRLIFRSIGTKKQTRREADSDRIVLCRFAWRWDDSTMTAFATSKEVPKSNISSLYSLYRWVMKVCIENRIEPDRGICLYPYWLMRGIIASRSLDRLLLILSSVVSPSKVPPFAVIVTVRILFLEPLDNILKKIKQKSHVVLSSSSSLTTTTTILPWPV